MVEKNIFQWRGVNADGLSVFGEIEEENKLSVARQLSEKKITLISIKKAPNHLAGTDKKIHPKDKIRLIRDLEHLLQSNLPITQALMQLSEQEAHPALKIYIQRILDNVNQGDSLSNSLKSQADFLSPMHIALIELGESTGQLPTCLSYILSELQENLALKTKIKRLLSYPITLLIISSMLIAGLLFFIVPQFEMIFQDFDQALPWLTQLVLNLSRNLQDNWYVPTMFFIFCVFSWQQRKYLTVKQRLYISDLAHQFKLTHLFLEKIALIKIARGLALAFDTGLNLLDALKLVSPTLKDPYYKIALETVHRDIESGSGLAQAFRQSYVFPKNFIGLLALAEETGQLGKLLNQEATMLQSQLGSQIEKYTALIEPIVMTLLCLLIGTVIIAMYLPIFQMNQLL